MTELNTQYICTVYMTEWRFMIRYDLMSAFAPTAADSC